MKASHAALTALIVLVLLTSAMPIKASDPVGIYAIVEKLVLEPDATSPQRIQIWGVFAFADTTRPGDFYTKPQRGYLYYAVAPGREAIAQKEWADFRTVAGTGQGIAFGARYSMPGRLRKDTDTPASPDPYTVGGTGVSKVNPVPSYEKNMTDIVTQLKEALKAK